MSKTKTLFTMALLVLLGSMGAAQAQNDNFVEVKLFTTPEPAAREGGENEMSGSAWFNFSTAAPLSGSDITLYYSVPLAGRHSLPRYYGDGTQAPMLL